MNNVKIQINSLEALERLIGGDSELEMSIRNAIVQDFTTKHLKQIANQEMVKNARLAVSQEIADTYFKQTQNGTWGGKNFVLDEKARKIFSEHLEINVKVAVSELINAELNRQGIKDRINALVEEKAKYIADELTNSVLEQRLNKMVDDRLKQTLKIGK